MLRDLSSGSLKGVGDVGGCGCTKYGGGVLRDEERVLREVV